MSYSRPVGYLGQPVTREMRTGPDGSLVPEDRSWFEQNKKNVLLGGAAIGALAFIVGIGYLRYRRNMALQEKYGTVGGVGLAVGLDSAEHALLSGLG